MYLQSFLCWSSNTPDFPTSWCRSGYHRNAAATSNRIFDTILALHDSFKSPAISPLFFVFHLVFSIHVPHLSNDLSGDQITRSWGGDEARKTNGSADIYKQRLRRMVRLVLELSQSSYTKEEQPATQDSLRWHSALRSVPVVSTP